jgi:predicted DNA-binding protein YlxM (UPF0122 family)
MEHRVFAEALQVTADWDLSVAEVAEQYDVSREQIIEVLNFVASSLRSSVPELAHWSPSELNGLRMTANIA